MVVMAVKISALINGSKITAAFQQKSRMEATKVKMDFAMPKMPMLL